MRKVLIIVPDMNLGGITTSVINFCNELDKRGHIVHFLNMSKKKNSEVEDKIHKNIKKLNVVGKASNWQLGIEDLKKASVLEKVKLVPIALMKKITNHSETWLNIIFRDYCINEEYDAAVAFRQCAPCYYFVLNCTKAKKKIAFIHGAKEGMGNISSFDRYFEEFDSIACVSNAVRNGFQNAYPLLKSQFKTVYNMLDKDFIIEKSKDKVKTSFKQSRHTILTVSRVEDSPKKIYRIPEICKKMIERGICDFQWYVVGDGPDLEKNITYAEELGVSEYLTFCGAVHNPYPYFVQCDFTVLTSSLESYGLVVVESIILGKPAVAMRYPALEEIIEDGKLGLIAEQNVEDVSNKIMSLIDNQSLLSQMKNNCLNYEFTNDIAYGQFQLL